MAIIHNFYRYSEYPSLNKDTSAFHTHFKALFILFKTGYRSLKLTGSVYNELLMKRKSLHDLV